MAIKKGRAKSKPKPKPVINYPPVKTKKWIPPDQRPKKEKPGPAYVKPEGIHQKLKISSLKKIWKQYLYYGETSILIGHYSQTYKKYSFKTNGYQGACNCAVACTYAYIFNMADWDRHTLDRLLDHGDQLYVKSTQQEDGRCLTLVPPEQVFNSFYLGKMKILLNINVGPKVTETLPTVTEGKVRDFMGNAVKQFFKKYASGIFSMRDKFLAIWIKQETYYVFDPTDHDQYGRAWHGVVGDGYCVLYRSKNFNDMVNNILNNVTWRIPHANFEIIECTVSRITNINTRPPISFEEFMEKEIVDESLKIGPLEAAEEIKPIDILTEKIKSYMAEHDKETSPEFILVQEISPDVTESLPPSKRPSWLQVINKNDHCMFPIPHRPHPDKISFYIEVVSDKIYILRGNTCQTDPKFSKYLGRQSMGNAISALIMLRFYKSSVWVPRIVNMILKYGDVLYMRAMNSIPRTQSLKLSDFQRLSEVEKRRFSPVVQDYVVVGKLQSPDLEVLDLLPALENYLLDHECCVLLGPVTLAIWVEEGEYFWFDPNERDKHGAAITRNVEVSGSIFSIDQPPGLACVINFVNLKDLVDLYMDNLQKSQKFDPFYISGVQIEDYVEVPEPWFNFKGSLPGQWILRGTKMQASKQFQKYTRNYQSPAMAFAALAFQSFVPENEWNTEIVDEILKVGNELYGESIDVLQNTEKFISRMLTISEVNKNLRIRDKLAVYEVGECAINGLINTGMDRSVKNLKQGLREFFKDNDLGIITTHNISVATWIKDGIYFIFDSHPRDEKGRFTNHGTAIVMRTLSLEDLATSLEVNLSPRKEDFYNISWVKVKFLEMAEDGLVRPPLNHYTRIDDNRSILRSLFSEISPKYDINCNKQTVPMALMALAFNRLKPSKDWTKADLDEILNKGDAFYSQIINDILKEELFIDEDADHAEIPGEEGEGAEDPLEPEGEGEGVFKEGDDVEEEEDGIVDTLNLKTEFSIGPNKMTVKLEDVAEGNIFDSLQESLQTFFEQEQTDDYFNQELIIESKPLTVVVWRDDKVFYYFDSKPRDKNGEAIGKDDWPEFVPGERLDEDLYAIMEDHESEYNQDDLTDHQIVEKADGGDEDEVAADEVNMYMEKMEDDFEEYSEMDQYDERQYKIPQSESFWQEQERLQGRACVMWFTKLEDLIDHIHGNIPPIDAHKKTFVVKAVKMTNNPTLKERLQPEDIRGDVYAGNWYDFHELDHGRWIMRGTMNLMNSMFPAENRGKQQITSSIVAIAMARVFSMLCFDEFSVDSILIYGDKLFSFMKKMRKKLLKKLRDVKLKEEDIDWLVVHEEYDLRDVVKKICIWKFFIDIDVQENYIKGDIHSEVDDILNVERALEQFFVENTYGLMQCKDLTVAIWRGQKVYYMFDGMNRGPNGIKSPNGTGCITRYLDLKDTADVFLANLPISGKNSFFIHKVTMTQALCPRNKEVKELVEHPLTVGVASGAFVNVVAGKCIVRGSMSFQDAKFTLGPQLLAAPIAVIALTMSLIHKPNTWSRPLIDEVLQLGLELAEESICELGYNFNPWDDTLDISKVKNDYFVGVRKANCEFRAKDQKGIVDIKSKYDLNLRQGLELFFEENTHGVITTPSLCLAVWEESEDMPEPLLYMYDPYPRGPTGMPLDTGTACVMTFVNIKLVSDHIIACMLDPDEKMKEFSIVPVEIVVGDISSRRRKFKRASEIGVLPRCSKLVANEQKRELRRMATEYRKRKAAKALEKIGRCGYHQMKNGDAIIRGYKSQNSRRYNEHSRNNQDIPNCIVAIVMHAMTTVDNWTSKHIDLILDSGDQLYVDSYIAYNPTDKKLGLENIMRKFYLKNMEIHVTVYKPIISDVFNVNNVSRLLNVYFLREEFCMFSYMNQWVSLFFKTGYFYMFDPHERNIDGDQVKEGDEGTAVVVRFDNLNSLGLKLVQNLYQDGVDSENMFTLWLISVENRSD